MGRVQLDSDWNEGATGASLGVDRAGNVIAVWSEWGGNTPGIWSNRFDVDAGAWTGARRVETTSNGYGTIAALSVDDEGNAAAVWRVGSEIQFNRWGRASERWGDAGAVEVANAGGEFAPSIFAGAGGAVTIVWTEQSGANGELTKVERLETKYDALGRASFTEETIASFDGGAQSPTIAQIVGNRAGDAVIFWNQGGDYWANNYDARSLVWSDAGVITSRSSTSYGAPAAAVSETGDAIIAWEAPGASSTDVWATIYR
jgi:hypothetical protein